MQNTGELPGEGGLQDSVLGLAGHHKLRSSFRYVDGPLLRLNIFQHYLHHCRYGPGPGLAGPGYHNPAFSASINHLSGTQLSVTKYNNNVKRWKLSIFPGDKIDCLTLR